MQSENPIHVHNKELLNNLPIKSVLFTIASLIDFQSSISKFTKGTT